MAPPAAAPPWPAAGPTDLAAGAVGWSSLPLPPFPAIWASKPAAHTLPQPPPTASPAARPAVSHALAAAMHALEGGQQTAVSGDATRAPQPFPASPLLLQPATSGAPSAPDPMPWQLTLLTLHTLEAQQAWRRGSIQDTRAAWHEAVAAATAQLAELP